MVQRHIEVRVAMQKMMVLIYIYIYIYVCVCVCGCKKGVQRITESTAADVLHFS